MNSVTPSSQANSTSASGLTPNEAILKAKEDYVAAQKKGDTAGMAAASKAADDARKAGGTISANVSLDQTKVIVANETIVQAKADYTEAKKIGDTAGMAAASKTADDARKAGGTISANESLEQAKAVVANDTIVQAKADYTAAQKKGDTAGMTAASKTAEDARKAGGTISANISLEQAQIMTANERILQAKSDYAAAEKAGDKAGMAAASKVAEDARNHGGTIAAATSYEDAREVVANATILQAKIDYDVAYKNKDAQGMADASKKADEARKNGGTIPASTSLEDAKKWVAAADGSGKPMDDISDADLANSIKVAKEGDAKHGIDAQIAAIDKELADLEKKQKEAEKRYQQAQEKLKVLYMQKEYVEILGDKIDELQKMDTQLKKQLDKLMDEAKLNADKATELLESYKHIREIAVAFTPDKGGDKRGSLLEEAASGFFWALSDFLGDTFDFAMYALEDPTGAGSDALAGIGDTANAAWDKITDPKATYEDIKKQIDEFSKLSKEDKARQFGAFLTNFSPSRRLERLAPDGNGHGGRIDGNGEGTKIEGAGDAAKLPEMNIDDEQFGQKVGKHAQDYGFSPKDPASRDWVRDHIVDIRNNPDEIRTGTWNGLGDGSPNARGRGPAVFFRQGNDVVVTDTHGNFVTILKDGINNTSFKSGEVLK